MKPEDVALFGEFLDKCRKSGVRSVSAFGWSVEFGLEAEDAHVTDPAQDTIEDPETPEALEGDALIYYSVGAPHEGPAS